MPKPVIHGRDHAPGGADPIPFTAGATGFQVFAAAMTTIASGVTTNLTFGTDTGDALTTAFSGDVRQFTDAGFYAADVNVYVASFAAGRAFNLEITAFAGMSSISSAVAGTGTTSTFGGRTAVGELDAGDLVQIAVRNGDTASRDFYMYCTITRLA